MSIFNFIESRLVSQLERKLYMRRGMILIEIIIALGIIAIIGLVIAQYQSLSSFWYYDSVHRMVAINKAVTHLESIIAHGFHESYFPQKEDIFTIFAHAEPYLLSVPVVGLKNSLNSRLISVRVEWQAPSRQTRFVVLRSIIS